jgi:hypothetical protein
MYSSSFDAFSGLAIGLLFLLGIGVIVVGIMYLLALQKAFDAISDENRQMSSGQVWLLLIPLFNIIWAFIVTIKLADSFRAEFDKLNIDYNEPRPTFNIGIAKSVLSICGWIPVLGALASIASLICWIVYWVKVTECRKLIEANQHGLLLDAERGVFHGDKPVH